MNAPLPAMVHEAEAQRQYVRLRMPVEVVLGDAKQTYDWSVGGFAVDTDAPFDPLQKPVELMFQFNFDGFSLNVPLHAEVRHSRQLANGKYRTGFQFTDMEREQTAVMQYIVGASLSGEIVRTSDVFAAVNRDSTVKARGKGMPKPPPRSVAAKAKRAVSVAFVLGLAAVVVGFVGATVFERAFLTKSVSASVQVDTITARAPESGALVLFAGAAGQQVEQGQALIGVERTDGRLVYLDSPCSCEVLSAYTREREFVTAGDPIAELAPPDAPVRIRALFEPEAVAGLNGDARAIVRKVGQPTSYEGSIVDQRIDRESGLIAMTIDVGATFKASDNDAPVSVVLNTAPFRF